MDRTLRVTLKIEHFVRGIMGTNTLELSMSEVAQLKRILDELAQSGENVEEYNAKQNYQGERLLK